MNLFQEVEVAVGLVGIVIVLALLIFKRSTSNEFRRRAERLMIVALLTGATELISWSVGQGRPNQTLHGFAAIAYYFLLAVLALSCLGVGYYLGWARAAERSESQTDENSSQQEEDQYDAIP